MYTIETKGLVKRYKTKTAVNGLDLTVEEGELFALLGVNGAGKTTTIRMLACLSAPTEGEGFVQGHSILTDKSGVKTVIGISPQDTAVAEKLTVRENLAFIAKVFGLDSERSKARVTEMINMFGLGEYENVRAKTLSGGWKRKLSIAMALLPEPKVLFLDEPTLGLDVLARRELWRAIKKLKGKMTIILTTHYMEEAEELSDRIAIMIDGSFAAVGTLSEIEEKAGAKGLENAFVAIAERGSEE
ncbi:MAG: ABC transporter ATP-binding protein [Ruminiclostridium sp.]|nr:ABC transporter ATP-binding protein [Ruminiclostridium sp.]